MKKKIIVLITFFSIVFIFICGLIYFYKPNIVENPSIEKEEIIDKIYDIDFGKSINIEELRSSYNNSDIIGYIDIPGLISVPVLQYNDNDYYLNTNIYKVKDKAGTIFMDFRNEFDDRKILIYGHSGHTNDPEEIRKLPFLELNNYNNKDFYDKYPYVYLYSDSYVYKYLIISSYIEVTDLDYINLSNFNGLTFLEHINKLKDKSSYFIDYNLSKQSRILILQTCSMNDTIKADHKYQLVISVLERVYYNK